MDKFTFGRSYIDCISRCKTEREWVTMALVDFRRKGFKSINEIGADKLKVGDKVYFVNKNKNFAAFIIGKNHGSCRGASLLGAHIDSPRLDVKPNPLYEESDIAYLDLQYYGGIKKYQWTARPLAIHGVICLTNGNTIPVNIGEDKNDPIFCISDLLPHLDRTQEDRPTSKAIDGENLDIIVGTTKLEGTEKKAVVAKILDILTKKYGTDITMADFASSELELVPAGEARICGLDNSLIAAYGQDDRVCAYTSYRAILDMEDTLEYTCGCVLVDKEEVGSICATGSKSRWLEDVLYAISGVKERLDFATFLSTTQMLSSDVTAAFDPLYKDVAVERISAKLGGGLVLSKYNGGRGKCGGADANPELIAGIRATMDAAGVKYQFDTMGKVDVGGGGTIASIVSNLNINVLDAGVPVLNMHSPMELTHIDDVYNAYLGYTAFIKR